MVATLKMLMLTLRLLNVLLLWPPIDDAYAEWYFLKFGVHVDRKKVLPVLHALQGHPESGRLWEEHINQILLLSPSFGFRSTTHDKSIYRGNFDTTPILMLHQVDDFALACCPFEAIGCCQCL
eukprot:scaffold11762_cov90-Cylindrotheca_fusiformis.AAC.1